MLCYIASVYSSLNNVLFEQKDGVAMFERTMKGPKPGVLFSVTKNDVLLMCACAVSLGGTI